MAVAEQTAKDFARGGLRNLADEDDAPRALEVGQVGAVEAVAVERLGGEAGGAGHDEGHHALAPPVVGLADHRDVPHLGMPRQDLLDLDRMDVLAAADDHVVDAARDEEIAVPVDIAHVAGEVPAVPQGPGVGVRTIPVAGEGLVRVEARDDLTLVPAATVSSGPTRRSVLAVTIRSVE